MRDQHTPQPLSALPTITDTVIIDGYTQSGATMATVTTSAILQIELDGTNAGGNSNGLHITAGNSGKESAARPWSSRIANGCFCLALLEGLQVKKPSGSG